MDTEPLAFPALTTMLKAAGEATRLRILALIAEAELTVSDLTEILRQSQPRLSRHLRLLAEAGLVERFREGSWAFFRLRERGSAADIARAMITRLDANDPVIARDRGTELFPPPRSGMGPHPKTSCRRRRRRRGDPLCARRQADPVAARSRHRHRPDAGTVRERHRARPWPRSVARHAGAGARPARSRRLEELQRTARRHLRPRPAAGFVRRGHYSSGAALPRRQRARHPRGGAGAAAGRAAACRGFCAARSRIFARG